MNKQNQPELFCKIYEVYLLWIVIFFGAGLRVYNLGGHDLWYDEVMSFYYSRQFKLGSFFCFQQNQLYDLCLCYWTLFFGISEIALRSLSVVFGVFSIPLAYKIGKLFFDKKVGLAGAFILAISPMHIWYAQEARGYTLSVFLTMTMAYFIFLALKKNNLFSWVGFVASSGLALFANYFCFFTLIAASALFFLKQHRHLLWRWIISLGAIGAVFLPLVPTFIKRVNAVRHIFWVPKPRLNSIVITFENFNSGYNATLEVYLFAFFVFSLLFILGAFVCRKDKRDELIVLCSLLFIPVVLTFLVSQITSIYLDRQLMLFSPFYYIIVAAGLVSIRKRAVRIAAFGFIILSTMFCLYNYYFLRMPAPLAHHVGVYLKKPVKPAADYIDKNFRKGDVVGYSGPSADSLFYYLWDIIIKKKIEVFSFVIKSQLWSYWFQRDGLCFAPNVVTKHIIFLDDKEDPCERLKKYDFKRLWLISSSWPRDGDLEPHIRAVRDWMQSHYVLLDTKEFDGIFIDLYGMSSGRKT